MLSESTFSKKKKKMLSESKNADKLILLVQTIS